MILIISVAIAIPSLNINIAGNNYQIRGLNPSDIKADIVLDDFVMQPGLELQGGKMITYTVDLSILPEQQRLAELLYMRDIISTRINLLGIDDFEAAALVNEEAGLYQLQIQVPDTLNNTTAQLIATPGQMSIWTIDTATFTQEDSEKDENDPTIGTAFEDRVRTTINNQDVASATVISDSRIFLAQQIAAILPDASVLPDQPGTISNYGVQLRFTNEAQQKILNALSTNPFGASPLLVTLDDIPIAYQASGQTFSANATQAELLLYTLVDDSKESNALVAALLNTPTINYSLSISEIVEQDPTFGINVVDQIKIALLVGFVVATAALAFRHRVFWKLISLGSGSFLVVSIALLKIFGAFNITLSVGLLIGYLLGMLVFFWNLLRLLDDAEELNDNYEKVGVDYRNLGIALVLIAFILQRYGIQDLLHFANGFGFAVIAGIGVYYLIIKVILGLVYEKFSK